MNKIEVLKAEKDGLDVIQDIPRYAREGWEAIPDGDRDRLKWAGVFFSSPDSRPFYDARAHTQRHQQRRSAASAR